MDFRTQLATQLGNLMVANLELVTQANAQAERIKALEAENAALRETQSAGKADAVEHLKDAAE